VQNAYWLWGPPPASTQQVLAVGFDRGDLTPLFADVQQIGRLHNRFDVHNIEQDRPLWRCRTPRVAWPVLWRRLRVYG
jgi:hypothetical protein